MKILHAFCSQVCICLSSPTRRSAPLIVRSKRISSSRSRSSCAIAVLCDFHFSKAIRDGERILKWFYRDVLFLLILLLFLWRVYNGDRGGLYTFLSWDDDEGYVGARVDAAVFVRCDNLVLVEEVSVEVLIVVTMFTG